MEHQRFSGRRRRKDKSFIGMAMAAVRLLLLFLSSYFLCTSYAIIDYPVVTSANLSTSWINRPSGTTPELTNWVLIDGSPFRPILFVREQGWSQQGTYKPPFAFGFFSNRTSSNRLFNLVTLLLPRSDDDFILTPPVITWVANRNRPVGENATLSLTAAGDLQLRDADGSLAWSTNTAGRSVSRLNFSDGGNLILAGNRNSVVWQSFDYPTDTWLPTQNIAFGNRLQCCMERFQTISIWIHTRHNIWGTQAAFKRSPTMHDSVSETIQLMISGTSYWNQMAS